LEYYQLLGVDKYSSGEEIKLAYQELLKKFQTDKNSTEEVKAIISKINEAYEVLSDPVKRHQYDQTVIPPTVQEVHEIDPREAYRLEYIRRKNQEAKAERERKEKLGVKIRFALRALSVPLLLLAILTLTDYCLPAKMYDEVAVMGWQETEHGYKSNRSILISYMQTEHFTFEVPDAIHVNYDYYGTKEILHISVSPILHVPKEISVKSSGHIYSFSPGRTIYGTGPALCLALLVSSAISLYMKEHSTLSNIVSVLNLILGFFSVQALLP
jgi:hypothetical protein